MKIKLGQLRSLIKEVSEETMSAPDVGQEVSLLKELEDAIGPDAPSRRTLSALLWALGTLPGVRQAFDAAVDKRAEEFAQEMRMGEGKSPKGRGMKESGGDMTSDPRKVYFIHFIGRMKGEDQFRVGSVEKLYSTVNLLLQNGMVPREDFKVLEIIPGSGVDGHFKDVTGMTDRLGLVEI